MKVKLVIDFEIGDIKLCVFNFYFLKNNSIETLFIIPNPNIVTLDDYAKLRKGKDITITYYHDGHNYSVIDVKNEIVKFILNTKFGNTTTTVPWIDCKMAFKQAYQWKSYF